MLVVLPGRQSHIHFFCLSPYGRVTAMLLAVPITFLLLHTPSHGIRLRLLIGSLLHQQPTVQELRLQRLFELLYYFNYVINWANYFVFGKTFRKLYKRSYCPCCYSKSVDGVEESHLATYYQGSPGMEMRTVEVAASHNRIGEDVG